MSCRGRARPLPFLEEADPKEKIHKPARERGCQCTEKNGKIHAREEVVRASGGRRVSEKKKRKRKIQRGCRELEGGTFPGHIPRGLKKTGGPLKET